MGEQYTAQPRVTTVGPTTSILDDVVDNPATHPHTSSVPVLPQLFCALGLLGFVFAIAYTTTVTPKTQVATPDVRVEKLPTLPTSQKSAPTDVFQDVKVQAKSAIVWDVSKQRILFNKNADQKLPLASITKLMTAVVAYDLLSPEERIKISTEALKADGDSGFTEGEIFSMQNLMDLTLISSSNDGAAALGRAAGSEIASQNAEEAFVTAMNIKAEELGLSDTSFKNSTGLDISETEAGAYGTARDTAQLMEYIITNYTDAVALTTLDVTDIRNTEGAYHVAKNTNDVVENIDGLIASKTGYTLLAGGNLAIAFNAGLNRPIVVVVLGSTHDGRFDDTLALIEKTRTYIDNEVE